MLTLDVLKEFGANVAEGLERCMDDDEFYLELIPDALDESYYKSIEEAAGLKDFKQGFEVAHSLKGILANLALTPILEPVSEITELFRAGSDVDYSKLIEKMWEQRNKLKNMME